MLINPGAGAGFRENLQKIIDSSLGNISRYHTEKTASAAAAAISASSAQATPRSPHLAPDIRSKAPSAYVNPSHSYTIPTESQNHRHPTNPSLHDLNTTSLNHPRHPHDHSADYNKQYHATPTSAVHHYAYDSFPTNVASDAYAMLHNQQHHHFNGYASTHNPMYAHDTYVAPEAWRQWAESMRDYPAPPQDYMNSANALVALGNGGVGSQHAGPVEQNGFGVGVGLGGGINGGAGAVAIGAEAGAFPSLIPDVTMHAAFAAQQGWGVGQGHGSGHGQGHGHNGQGHNGHAGQGH
jgi:hypothetical protein